MENEKRLIDAKELLKNLDKFINPMPDANGLNFLNGLCTAITEIEDAPTVEAVEVVHGRWLKRTVIVFDDEMVGYRCSECKTTWDAESNYCPNCGAKMDGDGNA